ncbi:MAG: AAA family ATPase [Thermoplasmata archaeon]
MNELTLTKIVLKNIRSHENSEIVFNPEGVIIIMGDVGSGKSSILQAINYALFGSADYSNFLRNDTNSGSVVLYIKIGEKELKIVRHITRDSKGNIKTKKVEIQENDKEYQVQSHTDANQEIQRIIGLPQTDKKENPLWNYSFYLKQEHLRDVLDNSKKEQEERIKIIMKALGVDKYQNARNNAEVLKKEIKYQKDLLSRSIPPESEIQNKENLLDQYSNDLKNIGRMLIEKESYKTEIEKQKKEMEGRYTEKEKKKSEYEANEKNIGKALDKTKLEIDRFSRDIDSKENKLKEMKKTIPEENINIDVPFTEAFLKEKKKELTSYKSEYTGTKAKLESIVKDIEESKLQLKPMRDINVINDAIESAKNKENELRDKISQNESKIRERELLIKNKICPTCKRLVVGEFLELTENEIQNLKEEDTKLAMELREIKPRLKELEKEKEESIKLMDIKKNIEKKEKNKKELENNLERLNQKIQDILKSMNLKGSIEEAEKAIESYLELLTKKELIISYNNLKKDIENEKTALEEKKKEINQLENELKELKTELAIIAGEVSKARAEKDALEKKYKEVEKDLNDLKAQKISKENEIDKIKTELNKIGEAKKEIEKYKNHYKWLDEVFQPIVKNIESNIRQSIYGLFSESFEKYVNILLKDIPFKYEIDNETYGINLTYGNSKGSLDTGPSGGERSSLALAYRFALNEVARQYHEISGFIILDEPTEGFSEEQLRRFNDLIENVTAKQKLIITHNNNLKGIGNQIIELTKESNITSVSNPSFE